MMDVWLEALDNDDITAVIMLDLSAAFDVVDHLVLIDKLRIHFGIVIDTGNEIIEPVSDERLLGCKISNNFKFNCHIRDNEKSIVNVLTSRINALNFFSKFSSKENYC